MARYLDRDDELTVDLRLGHMRRAQGGYPRLPKNLRQLGALGGDVPPAAAHARGAVVKSWIAKPTTTGAHLRYLQHGKGLDGQEAELFTREGVSVDRRTFARDAADDPHQYRLIVSLVDGDRMDLRAYTQRLMRQVERDLLGPIDWIGATHRDTTHVHTHLIIRGRDPAGKPLYIHPQYLCHGLRARAQMLATEALGPMPSRERQHDRWRTRRLDRFVAQHFREAKKEDGMAEPTVSKAAMLRQFRVAFDALALGHIPEAWEALQQAQQMVERMPDATDGFQESLDAPMAREVQETPRQSLLERLAALKDAVIHHARENTQAQDQGIEW
jgi:hypothetical protein